jgi:hypothetical protein
MDLGLVVQTVRPDISLRAWHLWLWYLGYIRGWESRSVNRVLIAGWHTLTV